MTDFARLPDELGPLYKRAEGLVRAYFADRKTSPAQGTIEIHGQRFIQVRAASMSVEFFDLVKRLYSAEEEHKAEAVARSLLFDIAHAIGMADSADFAQQMGITDPLEHMCAGPAHFSHTGWAFVEIDGASTMTLDQDFCLRYDHVHSFEAEAWVRAGRTSDSPVCVMNAGYSCGWCQASTGMKLVAAELLCKARGDDCCRFVMAPPGQIAKRIREYLESDADAAARIGPVHVPGFFEDHMSSERALHESEQQLRGAFEVSNIGMALISLRGRVFMLNEAFAAIFGHTKEELDNVSVTALTSPESAERNRLRVLELMADPSIGALRFETEGVHRDGRALPIMLSVAPVCDEQGKTLHVVAQAIDLTEERRANDEARRRDELLQRAQRLDAVGRLAGGMAHDFNNLLTVMMGYAEQLQLQFADHPGAGSAEAIVKAAEKARGLTQQLLAFSSKQMLQPAVLSPVAVLKDVHNIIQRLVSEDIQLTLVCASNVASSKLDRTGLEQVMVNLAVNARDAMPRGGDLEIALQNVRLTESGASELGVPCGDYVQLRVSDNGSGMDSETQAHIFEPFFSTKNDREGIGLGLATVYGFVQQSGGAIHVESTLGSGTTFRVFFPASLSVAPPLPTSKVTASPVETGQTILVIEDDAGIRSLLHEALRNLGYVVLTAVDGGDGIRVARGFDSRLDLVLTDIVMPRVGGAEAAAQIVESHPETEVLFMTGYADSVRGSRDLPVGAEVVSKPFTIAEMQRRIQLILAESQLGGHASFD